MAPDDPAPEYPDPAHRPASPDFADMYRESEERKLLADLIREREDERFRRLIDERIDHDHAERRVYFPFDRRDDRRLAEFQLVYWRGRFVPYDHDARLHRAP